MNNQNRNRFMDTEIKLVVARGEGFGELGEKGEGIKKYKLIVTKQSWVCKVQLGNIVNDIVITVRGARWALEISRGPLCKVYDCLTIMLNTWNRYKIIKTNKN